MLEIENMNVKVNKLCVVCLYLVIGINIYVIREVTKIINRNDLFVQRYEEFHQKEIEYSKTIGYLTWKISTIKKNQVQNLASKIHFTTLKPTTKKEVEKSPVANVYWYGDLQSPICTPGSFDTYAMHWNSLFPGFPLKAELAYSLEDRIWYHDTNRKITGFLTPLEDNQYEFQLSCRDFCEFILIDDYEQKGIGNKSIDQFLLRFGIGMKQTKEVKIPPRAVHQRTSPSPVFLKKGVRYLFDITSLINSGMLILKWRPKDKKEFETIPSHVLQPLSTNSSLYPILPNIKYFDEGPISSSMRSDTKNDFWKIPILKDSINVSVCKNYKKTMPKPPRSDNENFYLFSDLIYPPNKNVAFKDTQFHRRFIDEKEAKDLIQQYLKIHIMNNYVLHRVVNIERSTYTQGRYFIEIDLKKKNSSEVYRHSSWVMKNENMCQPPGLDLKLNTMIYLLTPIRNQRRWVAFLIQELNNLAKVTGDTQFHLVVVDFESTDCDVGEVLQRSNFNYTFIRQKGSFNKVKGLNVAVKSIKEEDPILFVFDLQLQFPLFLFDHVRKHTFRGSMASVPIMLRCACAQHPEYTEVTSPWNIWMEIGLGMISVYKSDWLRVGGMDEVNFGKKWGGEDWDFAKRVLLNDIEIAHIRIPGYFHLYHDTRGTWDGTKIY